MTKCYICGRKGSKKSNLSFHRFPADDESKDKWLKVIGRSEPPPGKRSTVCSLHFTEECFRYGLVYGMRRLKEGSIPSLYIEETEEETIMLNKRYTTSVSEIVDEVVNNCHTADSEGTLSSDECSERVQSKKLERRQNRKPKRKPKVFSKKELETPVKKVRLSLPWEKITSAPDGGKLYWEIAQRELKARKNRIRNLEGLLRRTKQKLLAVQKVIKDVKENPYVAVYVQDDNN